MHREGSERYRFDCYLVEVDRRAVLKNGERVHLSAKPLDTLVYLVRNRDRTVSKQELALHVWGASGVTAGSVEQAVRQIREVLGDQIKEPRFVQTIWGEGYRFIARLDAVGPETENGTGGVRQSGERTEVLPAGKEYARPQRAYEILIALLYSALYTVALWTETAYKYEHYRRSMIWLGPAVFICSFGTMRSVLIWNRGAKLAASRFGLVFTVGMLIVSTGLQFLLVRAVLPDTPITRASFSTYTARAAYLKDSSYFLALGIVFVIVPFDFVNRVRRLLANGEAEGVLRILIGGKRGTLPSGAVYIRCWFLAILLVLAAGGSVAGTAHLLDNLVSDPNQGLFTNLLQVQRLLYFLTAMTCLWRYYSELNDLRSESEAEAPRNVL